MRSSRHLLAVVAPISFGGEWFECFASTGVFREHRGEHTWNNVSN
jgi:hypothetical protein